MIAKNSLGLRDWSYERVQENMDPRDLPDGSHQDGLIHSPRVGRTSGMVSEDERRDGSQEVSSDQQIIGALGSRHISASDIRKEHWMAAAPIRYR